MTDFEATSNSYNYNRTYNRYAKQLEEFILKFKTCPPDIKFWPYGPYWPDHYYGPLYETPKHIRASPWQPELMWEKGGNFVIFKTFFIDFVIQTIENIEQLKFKGE